MNSKELISRWSEGAGASAHAAILRALQKREKIIDLTPFQTTHGRADFRGISTGTLRGVRGAELACMDLSHSNLQGVRATDCSFKDLRFSNASMHDFVDEKNEYERCRFQKTSFCGAHFGVERSRFTNCIFEECNLTKLRFGVVEFNSCRFDRCRLNGVDFGASSFIDVEFVGKLENVWFRGRDPFTEFSKGPAAQQRTNEMKGVSFAQAELWDVTFSDNCRLSGTVIPTDEEHYLLDHWQERLEFTLRTMEAWHNTQASNYIAAFMPHAENQSEYIVNRKAFIKELGEEVGKGAFDTMLTAS